MNPSAKAAPARRAACGLQTASVAVQEGLALDPSAGSGEIHAQGHLPEETPDRAARRAVTHLNHVSYLN